MKVTYLAYLIETIVIMIVIGSGLAYFGLKKKKGYSLFLGISILVYILAVGATFVLEKPRIETNGIQTIEVFSAKELRKTTAQYHFQDISDQVKMKGNINYNQIGEYPVEYEVDTLLGPYRETGVVRVVDSKPPELTLEGESNYSQSYASEYEEPGYHAIDEYEGDITERVVATRIDLDEEHFSILYEVSDSSGNTAKKERNVTVVDDIPPEITLNGNMNMTIYLNATYEERGATAVDEKDGDLTEQISTSGSVDTKREGKYTITYEVSDSKGNVAKKVRTITVKEKLVASSVKAQQGNGNGVIYLTFDDGPSTSITPHILDILKEKNVKATFFILNYNSAGAQLVKREYNEGHTVAIHGYSHEYKYIYQSEEIYMENLTKLQAKIKATTGYTATITRFPGGSSNTVSRFNPGIMTRLTSLVQERGFRYFDWNISSGDAGGAKSSDDVYRNVTKGLSKTKQNVVLMHDFSGNTKTLNALESIIDYGISNGYTFSAITESTPMVTHSVNN